MIEHIALSCSEVSTIDIYPNQFTCDQVGAHVVHIIVYDQCGRSMGQTVSINIQDGNSTCAPPVLGDVLGRVHTVSGEGIEKVELDLSEAGYAKKVTGNDGAYTFEQIPISKNYMLQPKKNIHPLNGVSVIDLVMIQQHILGTKLLDLPLIN